MQTIAGLTLLVSHWWACIFALLGTLQSNPVRACAGSALALSLVASRRASLHTCARAPDG